jgi:hypothetical protein
MAYFPAAATTLDYNGFGGYGAPVAAAPFATYGNAFGNGVFPPTVVPQQVFPQHGLPFQGYGGFGQFQEALAPTVNRALIPIDTGVPPVPLVPDFNAGTVTVNPPSLAGQGRAVGPQYTEVPHYTRYIHPFPVQRTQQKQKYRGFGLTDSWRGDVTQEKNFDWLYNAVLPSQ